MAHATATVNLSLPRAPVRPHRSALRQQASVLAVHNAKQKAQEMAQFVHQSVGRPITIQEEESKEWEGQIEGVADLDSMATIQQRIAQATVTVSCRVNMTFELKPKTKNKYGN